MINIKYMDSSFYTEWFREIQNWTLKEIFPQITKIELDLHVLYKDIFLAEMRKQKITIKVKLIWKHSLKHQFKLQVIWQAFLIKKPWNA